MLAAKQQSLVHQPAREPAPPQRRGDSDTADPQGARDQPEVAGKCAFGASQQMPRSLVEAVEIGISAALLDDKDLLAEPQQRVELVNVQRFKALPFGCDCDLWHTVHIQTPGPIRRKKAESRGNIPC